MLGVIRGIGNATIGAGKSAYKFGSDLAYNANFFDKFIGGAVSKISRNGIRGDRLSHQFYRNVVEPAGKYSLSTNIRAAAAVPTIAVGAGLAGLGAISVANKISGGVDKSYLKPRDPLIKTKSTVADLAINAPAMTLEDFASNKMALGIMAGAGYGILTSNRSMPSRTPQSRIRQTKYDMGASGELGLALHNMR